MFCLYGQEFLLYTFIYSAQIYTCLCVSMVPGLGLHQRTNQTEISPLESWVSVGEMDAIINIINKYKTIYEVINATKKEHGTD